MCKLFPNRRVQTLCSRSIMIFMDHQRSVGSKGLLMQRGSLWPHFYLEFSLWPLDSVTSTNGLLSWGSQAYMCLDPSSLGTTILQRWNSTWKLDHRRGNSWLWGHVSHSFQTQRQPLNSRGGEGEIQRSQLDSARSFSPVPTKAFSDQIHGLGPLCAHGRRGGSPCLLLGTCCGQWWMLNTGYVKTEHGNIIE